MGKYATRAEREQVNKLRRKLGMHPLPPGKLPRTRSKVRRTLAHLKQYEHASGSTTYVDTRPTKDGEQHMNIPPSQWKRIMNYDKWTCQYCGDKATQVDHVFPLSRGGRTRDNNLVAACEPCNLTKAAKAGGQWAAKLLDHPRVKTSARLSRAVEKSPVDTYWEYRKWRRQKNKVESPHFQTSAWERSQQTIHTHR